MLNLPRAVGVGKGDVDRPPPVGGRPLRPHAEADGRPKLGPRLLGEGCGIRVVGLRGLGHKHMAPAVAGGDRRRFQRRCRAGHCLGQQGRHTAGCRDFDLG